MKTLKKAAVKKAAAKKTAVKKTVLGKVVKQQACSFPTALGDMAIAWRADKITGVFLPEQNSKKLLTRVRSRLRSPRLAWTDSPPVFVGHMAALIRTHLRGESQEFSLEHLELKKGRPFFLKVYESCQQIPSGRVLTYLELAKAAGSPKATRAVGQAMATNPFPIVIPCHRVVGSTKQAGGFSAFGGLATKARLLRIESHDE